MSDVQFRNSSHSALRKAIALFVKDDSLLGKYCSYEQLHVPISTRLCDWRGQDDMEKVDEKMIRDAFIAQGGVKEYNLPFWQVVGGGETDPRYNGYLIHVKNGLRKTVNGNKVRLYMIGCTKGDYEPEIIHDKKDHPLNSGSGRRNFTLSGEG